MISGRPGWSTCHDGWLLDDWIVASDASQTASYEPQLHELNDAMRNDKLPPNHIPISTMAAMLDAAVLLATNSITPGERRAHQILPAARLEIALRLCRWKMR